MLEERNGRRGGRLMESGTRLRVNNDFSSDSPPRLPSDLVRSASDNKAAHSNPARGSHLGSDHWATVG